MSLSKKYITHIILRMCILMAFISSQTLYAQQSSSHLLMAIGPHPDQPVLVISVDNGHTWTVKSFPNLFKEAIFNAISCTGSIKNPVCVLAGSEGTQLLLMAITAESNDWRRVNIPYPTDSELTSVSCSGEDEHAFCTTIDADTKAYISAVGINGASQWRFNKINKIYNHSTLTLSCVGQDSNGICGSAAGSWIYQSTDSGNTWRVKHFDSKYYRTINCFRTSANSFCAGVGNYPFLFHPRPLVTMIEGDTLSDKPISNYYALDGLLNDISCVVNGDDYYCAAVGHGFEHTPLIVASHDAGKTWLFKPICEMNGKGSFEAVSCSANVCVAVGNIPPRSYETYKPLIAVSKDSGKKWQRKAPPPVRYGKLNAVRCVGEVGDMVCVAGGIRDDEKPCLFVSHDGGDTWQEAVIPNLPAKSGEFKSITGL